MSKRKIRAPLSVDLIHRTALGMIERDGLDALSMRNLAGALSVDPMAIYHHIPNKASLLTGVYETVLSELFEDLPAHRTWQQTLQLLTRRVRTLAAKYPRIFPSLIAASHETQGISRLISMVLGALSDAGLDAKTTVQASDTLFAFVTGFALLERPNSSDMPDDSIAENVASPARAQGLREALQANKFSDSFEFGLQLVISAIEAQMPAAQ